jgi:hypothetical protein
VTFNLPVDVAAPNLVPVIRPAARVFDQRRSANKSHPIGRLSKMDATTFDPLVNNARIYACKHDGFGERDERDLLRTHGAAQKWRAPARASYDHDFMLFDPGSSGALSFHVG